jgi:hypothetical protein
MRLTSCLSAAFACIDGRTGRSSAPNGTESMSGGGLPSMSTSSGTNRACSHSRTTVTRERPLRVRFTTKADESEFVPHSAGVDRPPPAGLAARDEQLVGDPRRASPAKSTESSCPKGRRTATHLHEAPDSVTTRGRPSVRAVRAVARPFPASRRGSRPKAVIRSQAARGRGRGER